MEIRGTITHILEERSGIAKATGNPWRVAQYVLQTDESHPKNVQFEVFGDDKIKQMNIQLGELLTISFDIDAREYNGKWFNQLRAWKVERDVVNAPIAETSSNSVVTSQITQEQDDLDVIFSNADNDIPPF